MRTSVAAGELGSVPRGAGEVVGGRAGKGQAEPLAAEVAQVGDARYNYYRTAQTCGLLTVMQVAIVRCCSAETQSVRGLESCRESVSPAGWNRRDRPETDAGWGGAAGLHSGP